MNDPVFWVLIVECYPIQKYWKTQWSLLSVREHRFSVAFFINLHANMSGAPDELCTSSALIFMRS